MGMIMRNGKPLSGSSNNADNLEYGEKTVGEVLDTLYDWNYIGMATGSGELDYSSVIDIAKELFIVVEFDASSSTKFRQTFVTRNYAIIERLSSGYYYSNEYNASICITINGSTKKIYLSSGWCQITGGGSLDNVIIRAYYR